MDRDGPELRGMLRHRNAACCEHEAAAGCNNRRCEILNLLTRFASWETFRIETVSTRPGRSSEISHRAVDLGLL
jgi:hypothetical protein